MAATVSQIIGHSRRSPSISVCILDDDLFFAQSLKEAIGRIGHSATITSDPEHILENIRNQRCHLALADIRMPAMSGFEFLAAAQACDSNIPIVLMTGFYSIDSAIEAIKAGAHDYLQKPFDLARLRTLLDEVAEQGQRHSTEEQEDGAELLRSHGVVGKSSNLLKVFDLARRIAPHYANVLLTGPTGTGKELLARAIHTMSPVAKNRLTIYNCSTLVETLAESHLFGHERGAFTGAAETRLGLFEVASGGTVVLDEIGEIPLAMQAKLLRLVQNREIQRVGSADVRLVDLRLIVVTHRNLRAEVEAGRFREDLFYRLSAIELRLPGLSERMEDVPRLIKHFCRAFGDRYNKPIRGVTRETQQVMTRYLWPGNVRELENVLSYACMMAKSDLVSIEDLPENLGASSIHRRSQSGLPATLDEMCERYVKQVMQQCNGDALQAARTLGIGKTTVYRYMKRGQQ
jgi:two-component system, NtrC family, response regulator HydG